MREESCEIWVLAKSSKGMLYFGRMLSSCAEEKRDSLEANVEVRWGRDRGQGLKFGWRLRMLKKVSIPISKKRRD